MDARTMPSRARGWTTGERSVAFAIVGLGTGVLIGASGPLIVVMVGPAFVAGPTWGGLAWFAAVCVAIVTGLAATLTRHGRSWVIPVFAASALVSVGILAGNEVGPALGYGSWPSPRPTQPHVSLPPAPAFLEAPARVTVTFDDLSGFVPTRPDAYGDGLFGHWCTSKPDSTAVGAVSVFEAGTLNGKPLSANVTLVGKNLPPLWIVLQFNGAEDGSVPYWRGEGRLVSSKGSTGSVRFDALTMEWWQPPGSWPATLSGEISWTCTAWTKP